MRTYITPEKLSKYNNNIPDICGKCGKEKGTLFHCFWQCDKIQQFWDGVRKCIQDILKIQIPLDAKLFILCLYPEVCNIRNRQKIFLELAIVLAKRVIATSWKKVGTPSLKKWLSELSTTLPLEKITYTLRGKESLFNNICSPFIIYLENINMSHLLEAFEEE